MNKVGRQLFWLSLIATAGCSRIEEDRIPLSDYGRADDPNTHHNFYYIVHRGELPLAYRKVRVWLGRRTTLEERHYYLDQDTLEMMWKLSDSSYEVTLPDGTKRWSSPGFVVRSEDDAKAKRLRPCTPSERPHWPNYSGIVWCAWDGNKVA